MLAIAAIIIFIWFYKSALRNHYANPWIWATAGITLYYISGIIWVYWIVKPSMGYAFFHLSPMQGVLLELSGIAFAFVVVYVINKKFLQRPSEGG